MSAKAGIGYSTGGHTGEDVPIYVYAPDHISKQPLKGLHHNTEVARFIESIMGLDLEDATRKLFVDVTDVQGANFDELTKTMTLTENSNTLVIKANQSVATLNGVVKELRGEVAVHINGRFYIPQYALDLLK